MLVVAETILDELIELGVNRDVDRGVMLALGWRLRRCVRFWSEVAACGRDCTRLNSSWKF